MGFFKKIFKGFKKVFKKIGKTLKKGFGKLAKAFGKLGPLGSIALNFLVGFATAGAGNLFMKGLNTVLGKLGSVGEFISNVGLTIKKGADFVKKGIGSVFNKISDGIELGLNTISKPFMKAGSRGLGSGFRDFVSNATKGFIDPSKEVNIFDKKLGLKTADGKLLSSLSRDELSALTETQLTNFKKLETTIKSNNILIQSNKDLIKNNSRIAGGVDATPKLNEVVGKFDEKTKKYRIWDSQESLDLYNANTATLTGSVAGAETLTLPGDETLALPGDEVLADKEIFDETGEVVRRQFSEEFVPADFSVKAGAEGAFNKVPKMAPIEYASQIIPKDLSPEGSINPFAPTGGGTEIDTSAFYKGVTEEKSSLFDSIKDTYKEGVKLKEAGEEILSGPREYIAKQEQAAQQLQEQQDRAAEKNRLTAKNLANEVLALNRSNNNRTFEGSTAQFYNINDFQQGRGTFNLANFDYGVNAYHESMMNA